MIFQHTWQQVIDGTKTQTRRLVKPGEYAGMGFGDPGIAMVLHNVNRFREVYKVGSTYAVQPGRGQSAVSRIRITSIRREDVREISHDDAVAEGYESRLGFLKQWVKMHDGNAEFGVEEQGAMFRRTIYSQWRGRVRKWERGDCDDVLAYLNTRPAERYDAWVLTFELCEPKEAQS